MFKEVADAIRKGATMCHQIVGDRSDNQGGRCVLGAIPLAFDKAGISDTYSAEELLPIIYEDVVPPRPLTGPAKMLSAILADLNNGNTRYTGDYAPDRKFEPWSFEKIADWLDSLDAS